MNHSTVSASTASAQTFSIKKTALAGMLVALTVALSGFPFRSVHPNVFRSSTLSTSSPASF